MVMLELMGFLSVAAGTRLKADKPLYGSSHIDYVRLLLLLMLLSLSLSLNVCVMMISIMYA